MFYTLIAALALSVAQLLPFTATSTWDDVKNAVTTLTAADLEKHMNLTEGLSLNDDYLIDKQMKRVSENLDCDFANSLSDNLFYVIKDGVKAAPHNYCRSIALSDFSADCTN